MLTGEGGLSGEREAPPQGQGPSIYRGAAVRGPAGGGPREPEGSDHPVPLFPALRLPLVLLGRRPRALELDNCAFCLSGLCGRFL